jgi:hypothetical protein
LTAGEHIVTFTYRPHNLYLGAGITAVTALGLALAVARGARRTPDA